MILASVRYYLRYPTAYGHVAELMRERGLAVDGSYVWRSRPSLWSYAGEMLSALFQADREELSSRSISKARPAGAD
jgi:hypothetical protein